MKTGEDINYIPLAVQTFLVHAPSTADSVAFRQTGSAVLTLD